MTCVYKIHILLSADNNTAKQAPVPCEGSMSQDPTLAVSSMDAKGSLQDQTAELTGTNGNCELNVILSLSINMFFGKHDAGESFRFIHSNWIDCFCL